MASRPFIFIGGNDDFLVGRAGRERFGELTREVEDEFGKEVVDGYANRVDEVENVIVQFAQAVQTLPMFGGKKAVWLKDVCFLADSVTGRAEGTLKQVERLKELLQAVDPAAVTVLVTASPVDRRRTFPKWCEKNGEFHWVGPAGRKEEARALEEVVRGECAACGVEIAPDALALLIGKVNGNTRLMVEEVRKLATYLGGDGGRIEEKHVAELVPNFGEGDFFEAAEAFFSRDLSWTLDALRRHFFAGNDARGLITTLQNRNRLLIQLRTLMDAGEIRVGYQGLDKARFQRAAEAHRKAFGDLDTKSGYNVFSQNLWYLGKLAGGAEGFSLRRLIDFQTEFIRAFQGILDRPNEQEAVMREMAIRCLGR